MDVVDDANLQAILAGTALHLPAESPEAARIVRAEWIVEAVRLGLAVDVDNAIVAGPLQLEGRYIPAAFSLTNTTLSNLDVSDARFLQAVRFDGCRLEGGVTLTGLRAESDVSFANARVRGEFDVSGVA